MPPKCLPKASRTDPEPKHVPNRVPNGVPRDSQNDPKIALWGVLGHRGDAKGLQGASRHPPRLKMESKWHPKSSQKRNENKVLKKRSLNRPLGCHGEPRGAPGSQNEANMDAKRLPKDVKKHGFFGIGWKTEKCDENTLFTTL